MKPIQLRLARGSAETVSPEAQSLWERARQSEDERSAAPARPGSLEELSDALGAHLAQREAQTAGDAASSFGAVHTRLMEAIGASTPLPAAREAAPRRARWGRFEGRLQRPMARQMAVSWSIAGLVAIAAGAGGHQLGRQTVPGLPADTLISDFDGSLKSGQPLPLSGTTSRVAASWLGRNTGIRVHLPAPEKSGVRLIGARSHALGGQPIAQTHYERAGVRLALYQMHAPEIGLDGLDRQNVRGRSFFTRSSGSYRLVAWRNGENVLAVVSPLQLSDAVQLAATLRDTPDAA